MSSSFSRVLVSAGVAFLIGCGIAAPAGAFAVWQGTAVIESTAGSGCAESGINAGKSFRVFFKPRNVGGNSGSSELLFEYERGAFQMRKLNGGLVGTGTYDGTATYFNLHNAGLFSLTFTSNGSSDPFDITAVPADFSATTQNLRLSGGIEFFFALFTGSTSDCNVTFRANLLLKP
jgi:hypothetical protein